MSLFFITSFLGGELGLVLNDGVFLRVSDFSLRDLDVVALLYRLLGDFYVSNFCIDKCNGYCGEMYSLFLSFISSSRVLTADACT